MTSILKTLRTIGQVIVKETPNQAFNRHARRVRAVRPDQIIEVKQTPIIAYRVVAGATQRYLSLRSRMEPLKVEVDLGLVDDCASIARAYWFAASNCVAVAGELDTRKEHYASALLARDLFEDLRSVLQKADVAAARGLQPLTNVVGYANLASDIMRHVRFYRNHWEDVSGKVPITEEELVGAEKLALFLIDDVNQVEGPIGPGEAHFVLQQSGTLLMQAWSVVRRCCSFLRWEEGDMEEYSPSLYTGRTVQKVQKEEEESPTPPAAEPRTVAPVGAAATPTGEAQGANNVPVGFQGSNPFTDG